MRRRWSMPGLCLAVLLTALVLAWLRPVQAGSETQLPTVAIPTVTGSPSGPVAIVKQGNEPQANLRAGPNQLFDRVGVLLAGQRVPAVGKSPKGEWIQVLYPGAPGGKAWIYEPLVSIEPPAANLPVVEAPALPTPASVATIDPTLAARFVVNVEPSRPPTFTPPPPLSIPTFPPEPSQQPVGNVPMGFIIVGLAALGLFIGIVAFSQR